MTSISVAIATYNEEKTICRCLESISKLAKEIVLVDGSSTDKTVEIAKTYKAKIVITDNPSNFHINKQKAIDMCRERWILQLDADEEVSKELAAEIKKVINNNEYNGYWIPRKNFFLGKFLEKGGQFPNYTLRLYKRGTGKLPCKNVHEQATVKGNVGFLKKTLLHYAYSDFACYIDHFQRYTEIFSEELYTRKEKLGIQGFIEYFFLKPVYWFIFSFFRHKGFVDGFPGFVFSFFSSLRFPTMYVKYWEKVKNNNTSYGKK